jgi:hypothetical protein
MRRTILALLACLTLIAGSAYGQGYMSSPGSQANGGPQKFGSATCRQQIPCASGSTYVSASDLAALGNQCVSTGLGLSVEDGFFDQSAGLDSNGCLTVRSELLLKRDSKTLLPKCCEVQQSDGSCSFHCDLTNGW